MYRILMIDDDAGLAKPLQQYFERYELQLDNETHPDAGITRLGIDQYDLVILDIMLPDKDGFSVCREIRQNSDIPIIMLTARGEVTDRVVGLELGADDYLAKPFDPRELVARIQRILKRARSTSSLQKANSIKTFGPLSIDLVAQTVHIDQHAIELTGNEFALVELLSATPKKTYSRDDIMNALRGIDAALYSRSIDILVSRLRKKLEPLQPIKTVWSRGYQWKL